MASNDMDRDTVIHIFHLLRDKGYTGAALSVVAEYFPEYSELGAPETPEQWLRKNVELENGKSVAHSKIKVIKKLREKFGLTLKDAKAKVDEYENT